MSKVNSDIPIQLANTTRAHNDTFKNAFDENKHWLEAVWKSLKCNNDDRKIYWFAFHQERLINKSDSCRISTFTLLPLINESINSPAMVAHCMRVMRKLIQHLNPTQILVITGDQRVYTLMKQAQWQFPNGFGAENYGQIAYWDGYVVINRWLTMWCL